MGARQQSVSMIIAGWFTVFAGFLAVLNGLLTFLGESSLSWPDVAIDVSSYRLCMTIIATMFIAFGVVAIAGGISALRDTNFNLALAGAALGAVGDGLLGVILGLSAAILLFLSNKDI